MKCCSRFLLVSLALAAGMAVCGSAARACGAYVITVSASPTLILVGGSSAITAHVTIGGIPVQGHTIQFSVSGPGSVSPTTRDTNSSGNASVTYTSQAIGTATITAKDLDQTGQPSATCTVRVFSITVSDNPIWWFNGVTPANYKTQSTLTADGPSGTFSWVIHAGNSIVSISPATGASTTATSIGQSASQNDVSIQLRWNGSAVGSVTLTVKSPNTFAACGTADAPQGIGFYSQVFYQCKDQFNTVLPDPIDINEEWITVHISDFAGEDWGRPATTPWNQVDPSYFADNIWFDTAGSTPPVLNPQAPLSQTKVDHWGQRYRVGSTAAPNGKFIKDDTLQRYRDHGRNE